MECEIVFFRVDANKTIGSGHLIRCLLIAQELQKRKINPVFLTCNTDSVFKAKIGQSGYLISEITSVDNYNALSYCQLIKAITNYTQPLLIIDSDDDFFYESVFQQSIRNQGIKVMFITIKSVFHYYADIVLNQSLLALYQTYSAEPYTQLLLGPSYFIIDTSIRKYSPKPDIIKQYTYHFFIAFGGADANELTSKVLKLLYQNRRVVKKVTVVLGNMNTQVDHIKKLYGSFSDFDLELYVNTNKIFELMLACDLAITSAGLTMWELGILNIPSLVIASSNREQLGADILHQQNFILKMANFDDPDFENKISNMFVDIFANNRQLSINTEKFKSVINMYGVEKVADAICEVIA